MSDDDQFVCGTTLRMESVQRYGREQLGAGRSSPTGVRDALRRYLKQGIGAGFSTGELIDWLGISSPSILDDAGFDDAEAAEAMKIVGLLTDDEIESIRIGPAPYLP